MVCSICIEPINDLNKETTKLNCGHCYHSDCIEKWFDENDTCPYCRELQNPTVIFHPDCQPSLITKDFISHLILIMTSLSGPYKIVVDTKGLISIDGLPLLPDD